MHLKGVRVEQVFVVSDVTLDGGVVFSDAVAMLLEDFWESLPADSRHRQHAGGDEEVEPAPRLDVPEEHFERFDPGGGAGTDSEGTQSDSDYAPSVESDGDDDIEDDRHGHLYDELELLRA